MRYFSFVGLINWKSERVEDNGKCFAAVLESRYLSLGGTKQRRKGWVIVRDDREKKNPDTRISRHKDE